MKQQIFHSHENKKKPARSPASLLLDENVTKQINKRGFLLFEELFFYFI